MSIKLDVKDKKLLYELDKNARMSFSELGKRIGVSKEVARYRLHTLEKARVIFKYFAIIDVARLGYTNYKVFIKLQKANEKQEEDLIEWLTDNPNVMWLVSCDGQFDIAFGMRAPNIEQFASQLGELENKFGHLFLQRQIVPIIRGEYFHRDYLVGKEVQSHGEMAFGGVPVEVELDELDWSILCELGKNARIPLTELAKLTGFSADAVGKRVKWLEKNGVIQNYVLVLDNSVLEQLQYKVLIRLRSVTQEKYRSLVSFCKLHPHIFYIVKTFGSWDFEMDIEVPDALAFRKVMREVKEVFSDIISDFSYITIYKIHKYNFCPEKP